MCLNSTYHVCSEVLWDLVGITARSTVSVPWFIIRWTDGKQTVGIHKHRHEIQSDLLEDTQNDLPETDSRLT